MCVNIITVPTVALRDETAMCPLLMYGDDNEDISSSRSYRHTIVVVGDDQTCAVSFLLRNCCFAFPRKRSRRQAKHPAPATAHQTTVPNALSVCAACRAVDDTETMMTQCTVLYLVLSYYVWTKRFGVCVCVLSVCA